MDAWNSQALGKPLEVLENPLQDDFAYGNRPFSAYSLSFGGT